MITKTAFLFSGTLTLAAGSACIGLETGPVGSLLIPSNTSGVVVAVVPSAPALTPVVGSHASLCLSFGAVFDLVVDNHSGFDVLFDEASFRLIDGTTLGGSPITIPSSGMVSRFGLPLVRRGSRRTFRFHERFGCGIGAPRFLRVEAVFGEVGGGSSFVSVEVPANQ